MAKFTQSEIAAAMTSEYPPTNTRLLEHWKQEAKDGDLQTLIACWVDVVDNKKGSLSIADEHNKVYNKLKDGFYNEK